MGILRILPRNPHHCSTSWSGNPRDAKAESSGQPKKGVRSEPRPTDEQCGVSALTWSAFVFSGESTGHLRNLFKGSPDCKIPQIPTPALRREQG